MPTQTWPRRAPPVRTAAAKKTSTVTTVPLASAGDMAVAGALAGTAAAAASAAANLKATAACSGGEVGHTAPETAEAKQASADAAAATANMKLAAAGNVGEDGRSVPLDVAVAGAGSAAAGKGAFVLAVLYACCKAAN